eukprot:1354188-Amphidinium_carterae.1
MMGAAANTVALQPESAGWFIHLWSALGVEIVPACHAMGGQCSVLSAVFSSQLEGQGSLVSCAPIQQLLQT